MRLKFWFSNFILLLLFFPLKEQAQQFSMQGNASQTGPLTYTLAPNLLFQAGMVTNYYPIDLRNNFVIRFQLNFGVLDADGADGFAFLLSNVCLPKLTAGKGLGVEGITNSIVIEFDTWNNGDSYNDNGNDHTGIYADGMLSPTGNITDGATTPVCLLGNCGNVEDGGWHDITIQWENISASLQRITVSFDGVFRASSTRNHISERFQNNNIVFWSVAGATGGNVNVHQFRVERSNNNNNNINVCIGKSFTLTAPPLGSNYKWSGGSVSATNIADYPAGLSGVFTCSYTDYCGINRMVSFDVKVNPNPVASVNSLVSCELTPATITATADIPGAFSYAWTVPSGFVNPGSTASFETGKPGVYSVIIRDTVTGCVSASASGTLTHIPATRALFTQIDTVCKGLTISPLPVTSLNGISGTWTPVFNNQTTTAYTFKPATGVCAFDETMTIVVNSPPFANLGTDKTVCKGDSILLDPKVTTGYALRYLWQDGTIKSTYTASQPGSYWVNVSNKCGDSYSTVNLIATVCEIFIPSAFTPNGNRLNDVFKISGAAYVKDFTMQVYNRWGQLIYETKNAALGWDGTLGGVAANPGMYTYKISFYNSQTGKFNSQKGTVTLIR